MGTVFGSLPILVSSPHSTRHSKVLLLGFGELYLRVYCPEFVRLNPTYRLKY
jgi:hypothetical protein